LGFFIGTNKRLEMTEPSDQKLIEHYQFLLFSNGIYTTRNNNRDMHRKQYFLSGALFPIDEKLNKRIQDKYGKNVRVIQPLEYTKILLPAANTVE
jgi:hypothetical protein